MSFVTKIEGFDSPCFYTYSDSYQDKPMYSGPPKLILKPKAATKVNPEKVAKMRKALDSISEEIDNS